MTREEAISEWTFRSNHIKKWLDEYGEEPSIRHYVELIDMAIEALKTDLVRCKDCKHQDECEEVVLFDVNDDEVMGHRLHWCSYGERKGGDDE